jgi:succinate dehydrogenase cytochrome b556 subunit
VSALRADRSLLASPVLIQRISRREETSVFVWVFHRITGLVLVVVLCAQLMTGFFQASASNAEMVKTIAGLHKHALLVSLLVFAAIFHGLYGIRTILLDLGMKRERLLFWIANVLGLVLFVSFLLHYFWIAAA